MASNWRADPHVNLRDIWGSPDGSIIWVAGFEDFYGTVLLRNSGNGFETVLEITDPNIPHPPNQITHKFPKVCGQIKKIQFILGQ